MKKPLGAVFGLLISLSLLLTAGCHYDPSPNDAPKQPPSVMNPTANPVTPEEPQTPVAAPKHVAIYLPTDSGSEDADNLAPHPIALAHSESPARDVLDELIAADHSPIPVGTTLRGIKIADGLATVDFSRQFQTHFHGGTTEESQTINSVLLTLGQFPTIDRVQILVDGATIDALSQLPLNGPLDVIRPAPTRAARASEGAAHG